LPVGDLLRLNLMGPPINANIGDDRSKVMRRGLWLSKRKERGG
jgi:hypothetical protein